MAGINRLPDDSIAADGFHIRPLVAEGDGRGGRGASTHSYLLRR